MTWARLDDSFPDHPKILGISDRAFRVHVSAICLSARLRSDGLVATASQKQLRATPKVVRELLDAGLWEDAEGGFIIHDYLKYNPSRESIEAKSEARAESGRSGGRASAARRGASAGILAEGIAVASAVGQANGQAFASSKTEALAEPPARPHPSQPVPSPAASQSSAAASAAAAGPDEPDEDAIRDAITAWTEATGTLASSLVGDQIAGWLTDYPRPWVLDAIRETGLAGAKSAKYADAILQRWRTEGRDTPKAAPKPQAAPVARFWPNEVAEMEAERARRQAVAK